MGIPSFEEPVPMSATIHPLVSCHVDLPIRAQNPPCQWQRWWTTETTAHCEFRTASALEPLAPRTPRLQIPGYCLVAPVAAKEEKKCKLGASAQRRQLRSRAPCAARASVVPQPRRSCATSSCQTRVTLASRSRSSGARSSKALQKCCSNAHLPAVFPLVKLQRHSRARLATASRVSSTRASLARQRHESRSPALLLRCKPLPAAPHHPPTLALCERKWRVAKKGNVPATRHCSGVTRLRADSANRKQKGRTGKKMTADLFAPTHALTLSPPAREVSEHTPESRGDPSKHEREKIKRPTRPARLRERLEIGVRDRYLFRLWSFQ
jgi:hypothetical protein